MTNQIVAVIRRAVEDILPWFDRADHDRRAARTERIRLRAVGSRIRTERMMGEYHDADIRRVRR